MSKNKPTLVLDDNEEEYNEPPAGVGDQGDDSSVDSSIPVTPNVPVTPVTGGGLATMHIKSIVVKDRIRSEYEDKKDAATTIAALADSLERLGQLHPIILEGNELKSGARRYFATAKLDSENRTIGGVHPEGDPRKLDPGHVLVRQFQNLTAKEQLDIEIEENTKRKGFNKAEEAIAIERVAQLLEKRDGKAPSTKKIARTMGVSAGQVTMGRRVAAAVEAGNKNLLKSDSIFGAYRQLQAEEKMQERINKVKQNVSRADMVQGLVNGRGEKWLAGLAEASVDLWLFDPPWGIGVDSYDRNNKYEEWEDEAAPSHQLMEQMIPELFRTLKDDSFMLVFFGIQYYAELKAMLESAGFKVDPNPMIWFKTNKGGSQNDPSRFFINQWEPIFVCRKGDPRLYKQGEGNVLPYPMPARDDRIHYAQKNVDMIADLIERFSFGPMVVGDPTFGSGSMLKAAKKLGRTIIGCEKSKENYEKALIWINEFDK